MSGNPAYRCIISMIARIAGRPSHCSALTVRGHRRLRLQEDELHVAESFSLAVLL